MIIPKECYEKYGPDLDGCSTQENEGCHYCRLAKRETKPITMEPFMGINMPHKKDGD